MSDICNLKWQAEDLAFELKLYKQQSNVQISQLRNELEISEKQNEQFFQQNELFEMRINRVGQKTSNSLCMGRWKFNTIKRNIKTKGISSGLVNSLLDETFNLGFSSIT